MEIFLPLLLGVVSGFLYNEHLYRSSMSFSVERPKIAFLWRFLILAITTLMVALYWGEGALLIFMASHLFVRVAHTLVRGFRVVRL